MLDLDLIRPLFRHVQVTEHLKAISGSLERFKLEPKRGKCVEDVDFVYSRRCSLTQVAAEEAGGIKGALVIERALDKGSIVLLDVPVDK